MDRRDLLAGFAVAASATPVLAQTPASGVSPMTSPHKAFKVKDCVALVTGANRGVGLGFVEVLLARGAKRVYATARDPKTLPELTALDPARVVALELDVTSDTHRRAAAAQAQDLTLLINNAAYPGDLKRAEERRFRSAGNLDDIKRAMDTNCWSPAELARLFIPTILKNAQETGRPGAIVNILSSAALFCLPEFTSYSTSKAAAMMMTAGLRAETDREPILVASVYTGGVQTRSLPVGATTQNTPADHANEVFDRMAEGRTFIYAATNGANTHQRIMGDPEAYERRVIDRFYTSPVQVAPY
ncbi:MAG: SDR family NAD(P)-dependent oxidoreductase [Rhodospirillaceae bacterium]|nr:SDR family NAD(P)-dependent oxidoreductase [Rhodospirillaceae bacterium]